MRCEIAATFLHNPKIVYLDEPTIGLDVLVKENIRKFIKDINKEKNTTVILDTDTYNECDDQFALAYLLKNQDKFNIEAITVAPYSHQSRNVSVIEGQGLSYNEILKICKWLNFNINNKVFKGSMD